MISLARLRWFAVRIERRGRPRGLVVLAFSVVLLQGASSSIVEVVLSGLLSRPAQNIMDHLRVVVIMGLNRASHHSVHYQLRVHLVPYQSRVIPWQVLLLVIPVPGVPFSPHLQQREVVMSVESLDI